MKFDHPRLPSFVFEATDFVFKRVRFKVTFIVACTREEPSDIYIGNRRYKYEADVLFIERFH